jgi:hypothetical protein
MANFAELDENNFVIKVHYCSNDTLVDENGECCDEIGYHRCSEVCGHNKFVQTSFNNNIRGRFAGIGYFYDESLDIFVPPQPYNNWILDAETATWNPPIEKPLITDPLIKDYMWNQEVYENTGNGWIPFPLMTREQFFAGNSVEWDSEEKIFKICNSNIKYINSPIEFVSEDISKILDGLSDEVIQKIQSITKTNIQDLTLKQLKECVELNADELFPEIVEQYYDKYINS